jgi:hypothetical protein
MRFQLNKTKMEKDEVEKEHREYKAKSHKDLEMKVQVRKHAGTVSCELLVTCFLKLLWFYP